MSNKVQFTLNNGAEVLQLKKRDSETFWVMADTGRGPHPFVCWTLFHNGACEWGHYFETEKQASEYFKNLGDQDNE